MLGPHVPDLRALELLVTVARAGSLGGAAAELGISQQAASSRVRTMEALVGEPLITRSKRGSELTQTGELVVQWADQVLHAAQKLDAGVASIRIDRRGHLDIAASMTIAEYLLPEWLVGLRAQQLQRGHRPTEIRMTATNTAKVIELVSAGDVTLGFVEGPDAPSGLQRRLVGADELVVVVSPQHPWASRPGRRVSAAQLAATPLVVREAGSGTRTVLERALGTHWQVAPALEFSSTSAVLAAVAAGAGPAAIGAKAVRDDLATGRLVRISMSDIDLTRRLHAVWKGGKNPPEGPARELVAWAART